MRAVKPSANNEHGLVLYVALAFATRRNKMSVPLKLLFSTPPGHDARDRGNVGRRPFAQVGTAVAKYGSPSLVRRATIRNESMHEHENSTHRECGPKGLTESVATWRLGVPLKDVKPLRDCFELPLQGLKAPTELLRPLNMLRLEGVLRRALRDGLLRLLRLPGLVGLPHGLQTIIERLRGAILQCFCCDSGTRMVNTPAHAPTHSCMPDGLNPMRNPRTETVLHDWGL